MQEPNNEPDKVLSQATSLQPWKQYGPSNSETFL